MIKSGATLAIAGNPAGSGTLNITNGTLLVQSNLATNSGNHDCWRPAAGDGTRDRKPEPQCRRLLHWAAPATNAIFTGQTVTLTGASTVSATVATNW